MLKRIVMFIIISIFSISFVSAYSYVNLYDDMNNGNNFNLKGLIQGTAYQVALSFNGTAYQSGTRNSNGTGNFNIAPGNNMSFVIYVWQKSGVSGDIYMSFGVNNTDLGGTAGQLDYGYYFELSDAGNRILIQRMLGGVATTIMNVARDPLFNAWHKAEFKYNSSNWLFYYDDILNATSNVDTQFITNNFTYFGLGGFTANSWYIDWLNITSTMAAIVYNNPPSNLSIFNPLNNSLSINKYTTFAYNFSSTNLATVSLFINNILNQTSYNISPITTNFFYNKFSYEGFYNYSLNISNSDGYYTSPTYIFQVDENPWELNGTFIYKQGGGYVIRQCKG